MSGKPFVLRYFKEGDNKKIITAIQKKIYFSKDQNIEPGYYVGTIIEDHEKHGVIDTVPLPNVPVEVWSGNQVGGVFVKANKSKKEMNVFLSKAPDNRDTEEKPIYTIELDDTQAKKVWGDNYKEMMLKKKDGVKKINASGYTPFEKLKQFSSNPD